MSKNNILELLSKFSSEEQKAQISQDNLSSREDCELELLRAQVRLKQEELASITQDRREREKFAKRIYNMLYCYLVVVGAFVIISSIDCLAITISDGVLITILGTTTANIITIFRFVARYLFK